MFLYFWWISFSLLSIEEIKLKIVQGEEYFLKKGELNVVGYYHANERYDDCELGPAARRNGDHIFRNFPQAAVLLVYACLNSFLFFIPLSSFSF